MGSTSDKVKGAANEMAGKAKKAVGKATDNPKLRAEGAGQEAKGKTQKAVGKAKDAVKGAVDRL
ncbi:CsbD family protein [Shinella daejeonensis]|uniref:CsbD family protein n=1 Tax=Shinella daejeonensis TaxID=659017 RepID=UPI0020C80AE2|nr:CsbD family protein [Shinella daejeonensis]MCP8897153.1 CsbD family protein [Shinella daejeonensis]